MLRSNKSIILKVNSKTMIKAASFRCQNVEILSAVMFSIYAFLFIFYINDGVDIELSLRYLQVNKL